MSRQPRRSTHDPVSVTAVAFMLVAIVICGLFILGVLPPARAG